MWIIKPAAQPSMDTLRAFLAAEDGVVVYLSEERAHAAAAALTYGPWAVVHLAELVQAADIELEQLHQQLQSMLSFLHSPVLKICNQCGDQLAAEGAAAAESAAALPDPSQVN